MIEVLVGLASVVLGLLALWWAFLSLSIYRFQLYTLHVEAENEVDRYCRNLQAAYDYLTLLESPERNIRERELLEYVRVLLGETKPLPLLFSDGLDRLFFNGWLNGVTVENGTVLTRLGELTSEMVQENLAHTYACLDRLKAAKNFYVGSVVGNAHTFCTLWRSTPLTVTEIISRSVG